MSSNPHTEDPPGPSVPSSQTQSSEKNPAIQDSETNNSQPTSRMGRLKHILDKTSTDAGQTPLPASILDDLDPDIRQTLEQKYNPSPDNHAPVGENPNQQIETVNTNPAQTDADSTADKPSMERITQSMRNRGFLITEDSSGLRLGGTVQRGHQAPLMSPYELVNLAAAMDGGIVPPEERIHCPACEAVVPPGDTRCQWCGKPLPATAADENTTTT